MKLTLEQRKEIQIKALLEAHDLKVGDVFKVQSTTKYRDDLLYRISNYDARYETSVIDSREWKAGQRDLADILLSCDITKVEPRWIPDYDDEYYVYDLYDKVNQYSWANDTLDNNYHSIGNCFKTEAEAVEFGKKVREFCLGLMSDL